MVGFYTALSMNNGALKHKIQESETRKEKIYYAFVLTFRAILVVVFAVTFVSISTLLFGEENSAMAVVIFVMLLTMRFIHFSYCIGDSLVTLAAVMAILTFMPGLDGIVPPYLLFFTHFIALFAIICMTTQKPEMGYGGLFGFAYVYLVGNPVEGTLLIQRAELALVGYVICAAVLIHKHRNKDKDVRFHQLMGKFSFSDTKSLWQLRLALGISLVLTLGSALGIKRFMWAGFACSSLLAKYPYSEDTHNRFVERLEGVVIGCAGYFILCQFIPEEYYSLIGLVGGVVLGFCVTYRNKAIVICFGALMVATEIYGVTESSILRVFDNFIGALFALVFAYLFHILVVKHCVPQEET